MWRIHWIHGTTMTSNLIFLLLTSTYNECQESLLQSQQHVCDWICWVNKYNNFFLLQINKLDTLKQLNTSTHKTEKRFRYIHIFIWVKNFCNLCFEWLTLNSHSTLNDDINWHYKFALIVYIKIWQMMT